jgi:hypothetical protein
VIKQYYGETAQISIKNAKKIYLNLSHFDFEPVSDRIPSPKTGQLTSTNEAIL